LEDLESDVFEATQQALQDNIRSFLNYCKCCRKLFNNAKIELFVIASISYRNSFICQGTSTRR